jgi:hypothetical protein
MKAKRGSRAIILLFLELRQWGGGGQTTPGRFTLPERGLVINLQEAALFYLTAQFYISFTSTDRRVIAESDVGPSVKGQVQPCYIYHGSQNTTKTKR